MPPWEWALASTVAEVTGEKARYVFWRMRLCEVFVWEQVWYTKEGWSCYPRSSVVTLEDIFRRLNPDLQVVKS